VILFCGIVAFAKLNGYWHTAIPDSLYFELVPHSSEFAHPR